jgi:hypothetical protein
LPQNPIQMRVIKAHPYGELAGKAKDLHGSNAGGDLRAEQPEGLRQDAVSYCLQALQLFEGMDQQRFLAVLSEVAAVGPGGLQINEPGTSRSLKTLPGSWSDLALAWGCPGSFDMSPRSSTYPEERGHAHASGPSRRYGFANRRRHAMVQTRGAGTPQAVRLPAELLERIDRHAARLEAELHLSVSRSDARRRLLSLALDDAEDTAEAEAILRAHEPRVSCEDLKGGSVTPEHEQGS